MADDVGGVKNGKWSMRRRVALGAFFAGVAGLAGLGLAGCAQMAGPRSVTYSEADLQRMLDQRFPMERRLVDLLEVRVSQPRLTLLPDKDRLAMELKVDASDRLFGSGVHGRVALESGLRLDAADGSIRLVNVKVTSVAIDNPSGKPPIVPVERIGALLAERMLEGAPLHQLRPDQMEKLTRAGYKPGAIAVTPAGITITVVPG